MIVQEFGIRVHSVYRTRENPWSGFSIGAIVMLRLCEASFAPCIQPNVEVGWNCRCRRKVYAERKCPPATSRNSPGECEWSGDRIIVQMYSYHGFSAAGVRRTDKILELTYVPRFRSGVGLLMCPQLCNQLPRFCWEHVKRKWCQNYFVCWERIWF